MGDWDDGRGRRTSVLGRVDWACWLAVVGLLFVTVIAFLVQFAVLGVVTAIFAILLVVFDSWVNRPKGARAQRRGPATGWSEVRRVESRPQRPVRRQPPQPARQPNRPAPDYGTRQATRQPQPRSGQGRQQAPRPNQAQPTRAAQQPQRQPQRNQPQRAQPQRQGGQPPRQPMGQPAAQPTRVNQGQQPRQQPFRQGPPQPARGREPDYRART